MHLNYLRKGLISLILGTSLAGTAHSQMTPTECLDQVPDNVRSQLPQECQSGTDLGLCGTELEPRESLIETSKAVLADLTVNQVLERAAESANAEEPMEAFNDIWASFQDEEIAWFSRQQQLWCDRQTNDRGEFTRNGYPIQCERPEGFHIIQAFWAAWTPIAAVNRFDMAAADGSHCGEQRLIFANNTINRSLIIFEAQIQNPKPAQGLDACLPVAQFWAGLTGKSAEERKTEIEQAFLGEHAFLQQHGFTSFMTQANMTQGTGQIRLNTFDTNPWVLREAKLIVKDKVNNGTATKVLGAVPVPVASNMFGKMWNDSEAGQFPAKDTCQEAIVNAVPGMLEGAIETMGAVFPEECLAAESADSATDNLPNQLVENGQLWQRIQTKLDESNSELNPKDIVNRVHFSSSCIGCHRQATNDLGGGMTTPPVPAFVHVSEQISETCPDGSECNEISRLLKETFLPHRLSVMNDVLCALSTERTVASTLRSLSSTPANSTRTIGGKLLGAAH